MPVKLSKIRSDEALAIRERILGPEHSDVGTSLNNLAHVYRRQGDYAKAEPLYQKALQIWERTLGPEHPNVLGVRNNLAGLYWLQRRRVGWPAKFAAFKRFQPLQPRKTRNRFNRSCFASFAVGSLIQQPLT